MHKTPAFLLVAVVALGSNSLHAQTHAAVQVRISSETCQVGNVDVPCGDVGAKLRELRTPLDVPIHLSVAKNASYAAVYAALDSIQRGGFNLKLGTVNVQPQ